MYKKLNNNDYIEYYKVKDASIAYIASKFQFDSKGIELGILSYIINLFFDTTNNNFDAKINYEIEVKKFKEFLKKNIKQANV